MIAVVAGGREFKPSHPYAWGLRKLLLEHQIRIMRHGGCRGADEWCGRVAARLGLEVEVWKAQWEEFGRKAGPWRNRRMIWGPPLADYCFRLPGGRGTENCVRQAREFDVPVLDVEPILG